MSELFRWDDALLIGLQEVDEQHRALYALLGELHQVVADERGAPACLEVIDRLTQFTRTHFTVEESLMRVLNYPDFEMHKRQHERLMDEMLAVRERVAGEQVPVSVELLHFVKVWLSRHIDNDDRRFGTYARERGVDPNWAEHVEQPMRKKWSWKFW